MLKRKIKLIKTPLTLSTPQTRNSIIYVETDRIHLYHYNCCEREVLCRIKSLWYIV